MASDNESNICQIYAMKNGKKAYEDLRRGFKTGDAVHVASVTKGIMALLTGIVIDRGYIKDTNEKVIGFFPSYEVKRGEKTICDVTIHHLLTMTAPYKYKSEPWVKVCTSDDWTKAALDLLGGRKGITGEFKYATLGIQVLTGVLQNASGESLTDLANRYLFGPLDIPEHRIHGDSDKDDQFDYLMNKSPRKNEWFSDPKGAVTAGWGLCLSACDMAKIGMLVAFKGMYNGKRVISERWIDMMTTPYVDLTERFGNMQYGYLWYKPYKDREIYAAIGDGGNVIYADPVNRISVGVTGTFKPRIFDRVEFIENKVLPEI